MQVENLQQNDFPPCLAEFTYKTKSNERYNENNPHDLKGRWLPTLGCRTIQLWSI